MTSSIPITSEAPSTPRSGRTRSSPWAGFRERCSETRRRRDPSWMPWKSVSGRLRGCAPSLPKTRGTCANTREAFSSATAPIIRERFGPGWPGLSSRRGCARGARRRKRRGKRGRVFSSRFSKAPRQDTSRRSRTATLPTRRAVVRFRRGPWARRFAPGNIWKKRIGISIRRVLRERGEILPAEEGVCN